MYGLTTIFFHNMIPHDDTYIFINITHPLSLVIPIYYILYYERIILYVPTRYYVHVYPLIYCIYLKI